MSTLEEVKELIAKQLNKPVDSINENMEIVKDLGADSLDIVEMLMTLEEQRGITISDEDAVTIKTVSDIVNLIDKK